MTTSPPRLPLNGLRSFEAAARRLSFEAAARDLGVTASAVSVQVRRLEDRIGRPLFVRGHRRVTLSDTGLRLAAGLGAVFDGLDRLLIDVLGPDHAALRISAMPSLASRWLAPRVARLASIRPDLEIRLSGEDGLLAFVRDDADLGVRYAEAIDPDLFAVRLRSAWVTPVCSPAFAERHAEALRAPAAASDRPLLRDGTADAPGLPGWREWFAHAGVLSPGGLLGPRFDSQHMALAAAEAGQGLALGLTPLIDDGLASGTLVRPFAIAAPSPRAFWFVCRRDRAAERTLRLALAWLTSEMEAGAA